ncbi:MAG: DUF4251 domain-containing protein [Bacteroidales bacterium]|nr:DUF4251 domain-containing protein [Bacteroidales bacterium]
MKKYFWLIIFLSVFFGGCKSTQFNEEVKDKNNGYNERLYAEALNAIENNSFVMEIDKATFRSGSTAYLFSHLNFIEVDGKHGVIQVAFDTYRPTPNGLGGITVDGNIYGVKFSKNEKGKVSYAYSVQGISVSAQVLITLYAGGNYAAATVSPNFNSNKIYFSGRIVSINESNIFKGRSN